MRKRLLLAGFPKSGNTWLGYMLAYLLNAKYTDLHVPKMPPSGQKWVLSLIDGNLDHVSDFVEVNKTHDLPGKIQDLETYDNIIHIIRDPRDVAVSYFFYKWFNLPIFLNKKFILHIVRFPLLRSFIWKMTLLQTARSWNLHSLCWYSQNVYRVRYEDLVANAANELKIICNNLNIEPNGLLIKDSINHFAFSKLAAGRKPGKEDKYHFFRKGIVGDYQNYFDRLDTWLINLFCNEMMNKVNYKLTPSQ
jgi:hypothetical protein